MRDIAIEKIMVETKPIKKNEALLQLHFSMKNKMFDSVIQIIDEYNVDIESLKKIENFSDFSKFLKTKKASENSL